MAYTHASLYECMRLYPPDPVDTKEAVYGDVLPDGTLVKKGWRVTYHIYVWEGLRRYGDLIVLSFDPIGG